ncbi:MAG: hypothetical protein J3Q66DRAFT_156307 [Benniella sp.]|nr:MAG: hypothetical protein J3Q66DRAFT_156307 [Benniella sp.]
MSRPSKFKEIKSGIVPQRSLSIGCSRYLGISSSTHHPPLSLCLSASLSFVHALSLSLSLSHTHTYTSIHPLPLLIINISTIFTLEPMNTTFHCLLQDRTGAPASTVHASVSQAHAHSCSTPTSYLGPNNPTGSAQTFHFTPGGTQHFPPLEHCSFVPQQFYQSSFEPTLINSSLHPSSSPPTQQQITQLQLLLAQSQQREEQLQWQLIYRDQWLQQFQQQQLAYLQQQQQQRLEQFVAPQNTPPFQEPLPMNSPLLASTTQPWVSEVTL